MNARSMDARIWLLAFGLVIIAVLAGAAIASFAPLQALAEEGQLVAGEAVVDGEASGETDGGDGASADDPDSGASSATEEESQVTKPKYAKVKKVKLNKKRVRIVNDGKVKLKATLVPTTKKLPLKSSKVTWRVSNKKVASVTQKGVVQGKRAGTVKVTAKAANGVKATATVKVTIQKDKMASAIPVLTYHRICADSAKSRLYGDTNLAVSASLFESQMKWLKNNGYRTISTAEFKDWRINGTFLPKKSVLITIDDGFYEIYHVAYPILKKYNLKATSFIIGAYTGKKTRKYNPNSKTDHYIGWDVINKIRKKYPNWEFQSHTYNMHYRGSSGMGAACSLGLTSIKADFAKNKKFEFTALAYPFGHTSSNMYKVLRSDKSIGTAFGYMMTWPATRTSPRYNIPRFKVFGDRGLGDFIGIVSTAR